MLRERYKQALWQIPLLILTAGLIALGVNHWRSDGIALVGDWSVDARFADGAGEGLVIGLEEAGRLFEQGDVLFVDARSPSQYAQGHIDGALSLPWQEADRHFMEAVDRLEDAAMVITYCDGENCDLSHELALFLKKMGMDDVRVLVNGWTVWQEAGLPIERLPAASDGESSR